MVKDFTPDYEIKGLNPANRHSAPGENGGEK
jgi:hypothetical protein